MKSKALIIILIAMTFSTGSRREQYENGRIDHLLCRKTIRIVVTDSGLGGLSVMEDIVHKIKASGYYKRAEIVFVNALFDPHSGYNALKSRSEKVNQFNVVLASIDKRYKPDAIVVACNTLSVLLPFTEFINKSETPVIGIVEPGVDMIRQKLSEEPSAKIIIFGTETTIEEESHITELRKFGIYENSIYTQACPQLQSYIEEDPSGEETAMLLDFYLKEAVAKLPADSGTVYLSLNCSHYGYSEKLWEESFSSASYRLGGIINPNNAMADQLLCMTPGTRAQTDLKLSVVSKVELGNTVAMQGIFLKSSPEISVALMNYSLLPGLF